uniref:Zinc finger protein 511 n=1 Tax=Bos mutus grunniens TaxID=30521 RepID=A0A8B9XWB3_BOSMU
MQLPPALHARLAGAPGAAAPLPVQRDSLAGNAPFRFAARQVRFPREHEFFEDGDVQRHLYLQDVITQVAAEPERPRVPEFTCQVAGCCQAFDALEDYEHHYHTLHGNVCSSCKRAFPSGHLLDTHIQEWHDSLFQILAERQDMYQCLVEGCTEKFRTSRDRKEHLVTHHLYPADFRFDKPRKGRRPASQVSTEAIGEDRAPSEGDAMEVCSEQAEAHPEPPRERRVYSHRIPSTVCFGQGASRGFKSTKKASARDGGARAVNSQLTEAVGDARVRGRDPLWVTRARRAAATPHNALWRHVGWHVYPILGSCSF